MSIFLLFLQSPPLDPAAYGGAAWGVLGALVFVIVVMGGITYTVFVRGAAANQKRDEFLVGFLTNRDDKTAAALADLGKKIESGDQKVADALVASARTSQAVLVAWEAMARARERKNSGTGLLPAEISQILKEAHETVRRSIG